MIGHSLNYEISRSLTNRMPGTSQYDFHNVHISQTAEVEKIALGQGKYLYHISDRFFINDRDNQGQKTWKEIPPGEKVFLGNDSISFPPQIFFGNERITLSAYDVFFAARTKAGILQHEERILCNHLSFRAEPGTLTGIMGPSGAGKTVLLNLLSGYTYSKRNRGNVFINETYDVHRERQFLGRTIGYVPQDDTLIPQLTVRDSLDYCFRLRYAGVEDDLKAHIIRDACCKAGFSKGKLEDLLPTRIGSPEEKTLSGGERKRVNIAHELIRNPLLLFLDEPTSGLSSVDSDNVIASLKDLCQATRITIILTIHQPSTESFEKFDRLLVVNKGGNIAYLGDAQDAVPYFEENAKLPYNIHQNPAEFILKALDFWTTSLGAFPDDTGQSPEEKIWHVYHGNPHYFPFEITDHVLSEAAAWGFPDECVSKLDRLKGRSFFWRNEFVNVLQETLGETSRNAPNTEKILKEVLHSDRSLSPLRTPREKIYAIPPLSTSFFQQMWVLLRRNQAVARGDKKNKLFQLLQPVAIAILMLVAFSWYPHDYYDEDLFSKVGYYFTQQLARKEPIVVREDLPEAKKLAYAQQTLSGEGAANRRASVWFLLIASCIWFGIINSCKEIVDERTVLKREAKSILRVTSYLTAKVIFLSWICVKQTLLLLAIIFSPHVFLIMEDFLSTSTVWQNFLLSIQLLPDVTLTYAIGLFGILVITAVLASWMGLLISSLAPTQKTALTVVPLVIIPQLLFGGLIRPIKDMSPSESFMLTDQEFTQLHQEIPAEILEQIQVLKNRQFVKEKHLRSEIRTLLGYTNAEQYSDVLLQYARLPVPQQKFALLPFHLHDLILQKWAFKALLLYNSLGEPNVLQKQLNFDRYREYEYVQFEAIHYLDLFFQDEGAQTATQKKVLLYQTLGGLVLIHALLLLVPNYYWLRRKLQY